MEKLQTETDSSIRLLLAATPNLETNLRHFTDLKSAPIKGYFDRACEALLALTSSLIDLSRCEMRYSDDAFVFRWDFVVLHILAESDATLDSPSLGSVFYIVQTLTPPTVEFFGSIATVITVLKDRLK
jgi:hypothetical protein